MKTKIDKILGLLRESDESLLASQIEDMGLYYSASYDKPLLSNFINRTKRIKKK